VLRDRVNEGDQRDATDQGHDAPGELGVAGDQRNERDQRRRARREHDVAGAEDALQAVPTHQTLGETRVDRLLVVDGLDNEMPPQQPQYEPEYQQERDGA
jgi:hypothetical protein